MYHPRFRHVAAAGALALIATIPLAGCGDPVSPRPAEAAVPLHTPDSTPSASAQAGNAGPGVARQPAGPKPVKTQTTEPVPPTPTSTAPTGTCLGTVRYDLDLRNTALELVKSMCFRAGGVLRLQGIGPGLVTAAPGSLVSQSYEGGVVDLRFVRPGTVTVTIPQDEQTYTITIVVVG
jgi:hypothetical protein